jgi:hypothetical protein
MYFMAVALGAVLALDEHTPRPESGVAVVVGAGMQTGGLGVQIGYYQRLGDRFWYLVPNLGAGYQLLFPRYERGLFDLAGGPGWSAGLKLVRGQMHRALLSLNYGVLGFVPAELDGAGLGPKASRGAQLGLGYEVSRGGYLFAFIPGISRILDGSLPRELRGPLFSLSISAGWKFR